MEEQVKNKKNHWTSTKVDGANKKINQEVYQRNRHLPRVQIDIKKQENISCFFVCFIVRYR